jgi:hypothetical protein
MKGGVHTAVVAEQAKGRIGVKERLTCSHDYRQGGGHALAESTGLL